MAFDVNQFTASLGGGLSHSSDFEVIFTSPPALAFRTTTLRALRFRCDSVNLPSRAPLSSDVKYYGHQRKFIYGNQPTPVTMTFILSENLQERDFFLDWQDLAVGNIRKTGQRLGGFNVGYYQDYVCNKIDILKYTRDGQNLHTVSLFDAFPTFIGDIGLSWSDDAVTKLNVTFDYHYFTEKNESFESRQSTNIAEKQATETANDFEVRRVTEEFISPF